MSAGEDLAPWLRLAILLRRDAAKLAAREGGTWTHDGVHTGNISSLGGQVVYDEGSPDEYQAAHIAANDPRDTIARCEAELAILDEHAPVSGYAPYGPVCVICCDPGGPGEEAAVVDHPCRTVRLLASGYRHWPGYQAEAWKP